MKKYGPWAFLAVVLLGACWAFREGAGTRAHTIGWLLTALAAGFVIRERLRAWHNKRHS